MKRISGIVGSLLGLVVLVGLAVVLATAFSRLQGGAQPPSQAFPSPIETPILPLYSPPATPIYPGPPATPIVVPTPIPPCTFAAGPVPAEPAPPLEAYHFSEPRVVLTHASAIGIAGWLPDGQRLLITRLIPGQAREYIETFDLRTGKLQRYGERHSLPGKPIWLDAHQAVAFADVSADKGKVLRISWGEGTPEEVATELAAPYLAASTDGQWVVFFTQPAQPRFEALDVVQAQGHLPSFVLPWPSWEDLPALGQQFGPEPYRATWHPGGNQIAFYNDTGFYLADLVTGEICEFDLGLHVDGKRWALDARWSPNGRYLSILTAIGDLPVLFIGLTILDTTTGETHRIDIGVPYIFEIAWAPNGYHLIALGQVNSLEGHTLPGLYVVDVLAGEFRRVLPDHVFSGGIYFYEGGGLAWSPDGQTIFTKCPIWLEREPTIVEDRLCAIEISIQPDRGR